MGFSQEDADCTTTGANPAWNQQRHRHGSAVSLSVTECRRQNQVIWNDKPHQRFLARCRIVSSKPRFRLPAISWAGIIHERGDPPRETTSLCRYTCRHSEDSSGTSILLLGYGFLDDRLLDCGLRGLDSGFGSSLGNYLFGNGLLGNYLFGDGLLDNRLLDNRLLGHWLRHGLDGLLHDWRNLVGSLSSGRLRGIRAPACLHGSLRGIRAPACLHGSLGLNLLLCLLRCSSDDLLCCYCRLLCCSSHCHLLCLDSC